MKQTLKAPAPSCSGVYCGECAAPLRPDEMACRVCGTPTLKYYMFHPVQMPAPVYMYLPLAA